MLPEKLEVSVKFNKAGDCVEMLYTALNCPSLIFTLCQSYTDSPSVEFAYYLILCHI